MAAAAAAGPPVWRRKRHRELDDSAAAAPAAGARRAAAGGKKAKRGGSSDSADDSQEHFSARVGDIIDARYVVVSEAGKGTFGRVLLCKDRKHCGRLVAVKAVRRVPKYVEAAKLEAHIMREVNRRDTEGRSLCVKYYRSFEWRRHFFIVTEPLGCSLFDYLKANEYRPLPLYCVQAFSDQLVTAVAFLHSMRLVHTDLKPENILLRGQEPLVRAHKLTCTRERGPVLVPRSTRIRLIDFGGATFEDGRKSALINTRQYRAPEVILGHGWTAASDMWSLGCILMELYTGRLLFSTHDSHEHLALMQSCLGPFPKEMCRGGNAAKYFHRTTGTLRYWDSPSEESLQHVTRMRRLEFTVHPRDNVFLSFVSSLLVFDPALRATAAEALNHPFFTSIRGEVAPPVAAAPDAVDAAPAAARARASRAKAAAADPVPSARAGAAASASASMPARAAPRGQPRDGAPAGEV